MLTTCYIKQSKKQRQATVRSGINLNAIKPRWNLALLWSCNILLTKLRKIQFPPYRWQLTSVAVGLVRLRNNVYCKFEAVLGWLVSTSLAWVIENSESARKVWTWEGEKGRTDRDTRWSPLLLMLSEFDV